MKYMKVAQGFKNTQTTEIMQYLSVSGLFHLALWPPVLSMLSQMAVFPSFWWVNNIPLCMYIYPFSLCTHPLTTQVVSIFLWIMLQWTWEYRYLFKIWFHLLWVNTPKWDCCSTWHFYEKSFFQLMNFFVLFLTALGLHCCARAFSRGREQRLLSSYSACAACCDGPSCCGAQGLGAWASLAAASGFSSCGSQA